MPATGSRCSGSGARAGRRSRRCAAGGAEVVAWDDSEAARAKAEADGIALADLTRARSWDGVKALIVSPGIPHLYPAPHPAVAAAWDAGVAVDNDIGLFFRSFATPDWDAFDRAPQVVGITGSNGKSTTTALIAHVLQAAGRPVQVGGNIGRGVLDLDPAEDGMVVVLELSSYQIELARALQPDIAVFLNLSPDHLDRHGGMGGYFAAKRRLFTQGGPSRSIIGVDENEGRFLANAMREEAGTGDPVIAVSVTRKLARAGLERLRAQGLPRRVAARAAGGLDRPARRWRRCRARTTTRTPAPPMPRRAASGSAPRQIEAALASYPGPRAPQPARSRPGSGVRIVNDSQGDQRRRGGEGAARASSASAGSPAGGRRRAGSRRCGRCSARVAKAYLIGEAAEDFAATLGETPHVVAGTLDAAVAAALAEAEAGEVVLLAPACASFDQFESFEERGRGVRGAGAGADRWLRRDRRRSAPSTRRRPTASTASGTGAWSSGRGSTGSWRWCRPGRRCSTSAAAPASRSRAT